MVLSLDEDSMQVRPVLPEAPHGTATALEDKDLANPMPMILVGAALPTYIGSNPASRASMAMVESAFDAVSKGIATPDLGGQATTTEHTDEVIRRVRSTLDVWEALG